MNEVTSRQQVMSSDNEGHPHMGGNPLSSRFPNHGDPTTAGSSCPAHPWDRWTPGKRSSVEWEEPKVGVHPKLPNIDPAVHTTQPRPDHTPYPPQLSAAGHPLPSTIGTPHSTYAQGNPGNSTNAPGPSLIESPLREAPVSLMERASFEESWGNDDPQSFNHRASMSSNTSLTMARQRALSVARQNREKIGTDEEQRQFIERFRLMALYSKNGGGCGGGGGSGRGQDEMGWSFDSGMTRQASCGDAALGRLESIETSSFGPTSSSESSISSVEGNPPEVKGEATPTTSSSEGSSKPMRKRSSNHKLERSGHVSSVDMAAAGVESPPPQPRPHRPLQRQETEQDKHFLRGQRSSIHLTSTTTRSDEDDDIIENGSDFIGQEAIGGETPIQRTDSLSSNAGGVGAKMVLERGSIGMDHLESIRRTQEKMLGRGRESIGPSNPSNRSNRSSGHGSDMSEITTPSSLSPNPSDPTSSQPSSLGDSGTGADVCSNSSGNTGGGGRAEPLLPHFDGFHRNQSLDPHIFTRDLHPWEEPKVGKLPQLPEFYPSNYHQSHPRLLDYAPLTDHTPTAPPSLETPVNGSYPSSSLSDHTLTPSDHTPQSHGQPRLSCLEEQFGEHHHDNGYHHGNGHHHGYGKGSQVTYPDRNSKELDPHIFYKPPSRGAGSRAPHKGEGPGGSHAHLRQSSTSDNSEVSWSGSEGAEPRSPSPSPDGSQDQHASVDWEKVRVHTKPPDIYPPIHHRPDHAPSTGHAPSSSALTREEMIHEMYLTIDRVREQHKDDLLVLRHRRKMLTQQTPLGSPSSDNHITRKILKLDLDASAPDHHEVGVAATTDRPSLFPETEMDLYRRTIESISEDRAEPDVTHRQYLRQYLLGQFCKKQIYREDTHWVRQSRLG